MHRSRSAVAAITLAGSLLLSMVGGVSGQSPSASPDAPPSASPDPSPAVLPSESPGWETPPTNPEVPGPEWSLDDVPAFLEGLSPFTTYLVMQCVTNAEQGPEGDDWAITNFSDLDYCLEAIRLLDPEGGLDWTAGVQVEAEVELRKLPLEKWDDKISWRWLEKGEITCPSGVEGCYGLLVKARKACPKGVVVKLIVHDENGREIDILRKSIKKLAKGKQEALVISTQKPAADKAYVDSIVCR